MVQSEPVRDFGMRAIAETVAVARALRLIRRWMLLAPETPEPVVKDNEVSEPVAMIGVDGMEGIRDEAAMFLRQSRRWAAAHGMHEWFWCLVAAGRRHV